MDAPPETLKALFPVPSPAPRNIRFTPRPLPGLTYDSAQAALEYLKDNHRKRHIFFNDQHFHKSVFVRYIFSHIADVIVYTAMPPTTC